MLDYKDAEPMGVPQSLVPQTLTSDCVSVP
jgi:hypothetical protein